MSRLTDRKIEALLREGKTPEPPPELLERLRRDLPETVDTPASSPAPRRRPARYRWAWAASFLIAVGGAFLGVRVFQEAPAPTTRPDALAPAEAPEGESSPGQLERRQTEIARSDLPRAEAFESRLEETKIDRSRESKAGSEATAGKASQPARRQKKAQPLEPAGASSSERAILPSASPLTQRPEKVETYRGGSPRVESSLKKSQRDAQTEEILELAEESIPGNRRPADMERVPHQAAAATAPVEVRSREVASARLADEIAPISVESRDERQPRPRPEPPPEPASVARDEGFDRTYHRHYGVHPFVDTEVDALSTFGLDVDTASYTLVRRYLDDGHLPPPAAVRVEEMINFFDYGDPAPGKGDFALYAEGAPSPYDASGKHWLLRLHLRGREVEVRDRPPADLIFVVDVSGSMQRENRLELVKEALYLLLDELGPHDRVALVVYGSRGQVLLAPTGNLARIRDGITELRPGGSTNAEEGLMLAYDLALETGRPGAIQRIILCSDGVANVGRTGAESILSSVRSRAAEGIELTTVGFGMGNFNDVLMEQLADLGDGRYAYVDDLDEAHRVFVENLTGTLLTIASDARVQVELEPGIVERYRLVGYENRDIADQDFRNDAVDAGEIGAGHGVTALYELELRHKPRRGERVATLRLRYLSRSSGRVEEDVLEVEGKAFSRSWREASRALRLTTVVAEFGETLRGSSWGRESELENLFRRSQELGGELAGDHEVAELVALIGRATRLRDREID